MSDWISVKDRLPEEGERVWVAIAGLWFGCVCKGITYALSCSRGGG